MAITKVPLTARQIALIGARSTHAAAALNPTEDAITARARPFSEVPRPGKLRFLRGFMPGGEFHNNNITELVSTLRARYGDVFLMPGFFGRNDLVVTFSPKDIETVFRNEGAWPYRGVFDSMVYFREHIRPDVYEATKGLVATQGEEWGKLRSALNPVFMQPKGLKMYYAPLSNINNEFIERIKEIRDPKTLEVPDNFEEEMARMIFESISLISFNRELGIIRKRRDNPDALTLFKSSREIFRLSLQLDVQPSIWKYISTPAFRKMMRLLNESLDVCQRLVEEGRLDLERRRAAGEQTSNNSIMDRMLDIDPKIAVIMGMDILFAGVDGSMILLSALLLCLSKNQDKQHKLREELMRVMPTKETLLNEESMKDMPYLRAVIKEALSQWTWHLPKDNAYYPQADRFLPERWLRDAGTNKKTQISPFSFLPFGFGPRQCIGKRVVDLEIETSLAKIIRNFHVEFNHDASKPYETTFFMEPAIKFRFKFTDVEY